MKTISTSDWHKKCQLILYETPSCWSAFLLLQIFTGTRTSYSHNPDLPVREFPQVVGKQTVDSRPGRMPEWFLLDPWSEPVGGEKAASGNEALTGWCFKQSGVLRVEIISHHRKGEVEMPSFYTTKE